MEIIFNHVYVIFWIIFRCKQDFYNDDQRVRHSLYSATPLSYPEYIKKMIADLDEAGMDVPKDIKEKYM